MKKGLVLVLAALVVLPGCWGRKKDKQDTQKGKKNIELRAEVDMPVAGDEMNSYFDADANELTLLDDKDIAQELGVEETEQAVVAANDFDWAKEEGSKDSFANVYFDFDADGIRQDQEAYIAQNIEHAKAILARGETPVITIEGNACSSAGSRGYNVAISNNRASVVADRFVACGVARDNIKILGRGSDNPVLDANGNPVSGDRSQQWPNRRVELKLYS